MVENGFDAFALKGGWKKWTSEEKATVPAS